MNEPLVAALDRLLSQENVKAMSHDDICRDLMQPTVQDLEAFHDQEATVLHKAHGFLDEYLEGREGVDGPGALKHVAEYMRSEASEFGEAAVKFAQFERQAEQLGYLEEGHEAFFLSVIHYLRLIQLDSVAYWIGQELGEIERMSLDAVVAHVRGILDNDIYAVDHGLEDVRRCYVEALLQDAE